MMKLDIYYSEIQYENSQFFVKHSEGICDDKLKAIFCEMDVEYS